MRKWADPRDAETGRVPLQDATILFKEPLVHIARAHWRTSRCAVSVEWCTLVVAAGHWGDGDLVPSRGATRGKLEANQDCVHQCLGLQTDEWGFTITTRGQ